VSGVYPDFSGWLNEKMDWRTLKRILKILFKKRRRKKPPASIFTTLRQRIQLPSAITEIIVSGILILLLIPQVSVFGLNSKQFFSLCLMILIFMSIYDSFLTQFHPKVKKSESQVFLIGSSVAIIVLICEILQAVEFSFYLLPLAFVGMMLTILIDLRIGLLMLVLADLLVCYLGRGDLNLFSILFVGSIVGSFKVVKVRERASIIKGGFYTSVVNLLVILAISSLTEQFPYPVWLWAGLNGILAAFLTIGALPFFENAFGLTSNIRLMEMADFNQPLLKRLMHEAPGTYHHSLLVADLAEESADAINCDSLLVRVGAYYHDIGKLVHPDYFIENHSVSDNKHRGFNPSMSSLILVNHIKEGIALAKRYHLPLPIVDLIAQHHGTSLIKFFYQQAKNKFSPEKVDEQPYRYPGPKPQTREAALVMLADQVEAAAKSLSSKLSPGNFKNLVEEIVENNYTDGQLNDCEMTFEDLQKIKVCFTRVLCGIYHQRIEYPT